MTTTTRIGLGLSAALVSLGLAFAPAVFAQDKMGKDDGMKKESAAPSFPATNAKRLRKGAMLKHRPLRLEIPRCAIAHLGLALTHQPGMMGGLNLSLAGDGGCAFCPRLLAYFFLPLPL